GGRTSQGAPARSTASASPDVLRLSFAGADPQARIVASDDLLSRSNYFIGSDPTQWHQDVPQYGQVQVQGLYPGIDLRYYSTAAGQLEYDFVVHPGANPAAIRLALQGAQTVTLDTQGQLHLATAQ